MFMRSAAIKTVTGFFLAYFALGSLVFLGQDLTIRQTAGGSWCVSLADHSHSGLFHYHDKGTSLNSSRQHDNHKHKPGEIHICLEHHKFLGASYTLAIPGDNLQKTRDSVSETGRNLVELNHFQTISFFQGHDPGPPLPGLSPYSILLL